MLLMVDIPIDEYEHIVYEDDGIEELRDKIAESTPIRSWLKSFNVDSATECFTAIQELRKKVGGC